MSPQSVLIIGRSALVLIDAVDMLRARGYAANASNQYDTLLDAYELANVDLIIFGGMVPPDVKGRLQAHISAINPRATFRQGLGGIASLLVAQVDGFFRGEVPGVGFDGRRRVISITLPRAEHTTVEGLWARFVPPNPIAQSAVIFDGDLSAGTHEIAVPAEVPEQGSYAAVRVGGRVSALQIGDTPQSVKRIASAQSLPAPDPVTTRFPWN